MRGRCKIEFLNFEIGSLKVTFSKRPKFSQRQKSKGLLIKIHFVKILEQSIKIRLSMMWHWGILQYHPSVHSFIHIQSGNHHRTCVRFPKDNSHHLYFWCCGITHSNKKGHFIKIFMLLRKHNILWVWIKFNQRTLGQKSQHTYISINIKLDVQQRLQSRQFI